VLDLKDERSEGKPELPFRDDEEVLLTRVVRDHLDRVTTFWHRPELHLAS